MSSTDDIAPPAGRRTMGVALLVVLVFALLALATHDWKDIPLLMADAPRTPANLIGPAGAWSAFVAFMTFGVGAYLSPLWLLGIGLTLLISRRPRVWPEILLCTTAWVFFCFAQELHGSFWASQRAELNLGDFTSGIVGQWIMRGVLIRFFSRTGAGILVWSVFAMALVMFVGPRNLLQLARFTRRIFVSRIENWRRRAQDQQSLIEREEKRLLKERRKLEKSLRQQEKPPDRSDLAAVKAPQPVAATIPEPPVRRRPAPATPASPPATAEPTPGPGAAPPLYRLPPVTLLNPPDAPVKEKGVEADIGVTARILTATLAEFGIEAEVTNVERGPVVTRYELRPAPGIRVERISNLSANLALTLKATSVRVQAPIPGKGVVGIEVPNAMSTMVYIREIIESAAWQSGKARLPLVLGKDVGGNDLVADLATMPHLLVAGATGAGKTVCMNSILTGLLMARTPDEMRLVLVDPKIVEFSAFNQLPHLVVPVITNPKKVALGLRWAINEMEKRYKLFARVGVRNIEGYNHRMIAHQAELFGEAAAAPPPPKDEPPRTVPYIVIVIDELADLMLADQAEIENNIARLAQLSRAVGIHMIISTQRPSVNVITGTIKANFPARIAFQVAQRVDSRTILDTVGADKLLGRGDMLFLPPGTSKIVRAQGAMCGDDEIHRVVEFIRAQGEPNYETEIHEKIETSSASSRPDLDDGEDEELINQSIEIIRETRRASTSSLQRRLRIGYTRAARVMDVLEERGIIGPPRGSDPREILLDLDGEIPDNNAPNDAGADFADAEDETDVLPPEQT